MSREAGLILPLSLLALLVLILATGEAEAAGVQASCASVHFNSGAGTTRDFYVGTNVNPGVLTCDTTNTGFTDLGSGDSLSLKCKSAGDAGTIESTITVKGFADNDEFGNEAATPIWTFTQGACQSQTTFTIYCTSDGTSTGSPRYGPIRLTIRAQRTTVPIYDVYSDDTGVWGIYRCNPSVSSLSDGNPTTSPSEYVGGDLFRTTVTVDAAPYHSVTNARSDVLCSGNAHAGTALMPTTSAATSDKTLKGLTSTLPTGCTLSHSVVVTKTSSIQDLSSVYYYTWDATGAPADVTFTSTTATRSTTKQLDRAITFSGCSESIGGQTHTRAMAGEAVLHSCTLTNARGESVPNGGLARGWLRRASAGAYATIDAPSTDFTFSAGGAASWSSQLDTDAIDTNASSALDYVLDVKAYSLSRADTELTNYGTSTGLLDVTNDLDVTGIDTSPGGACTGTQSAVFVLASDLIGMREGYVQDTRGNVVTRSLTFSRTYQEPDSGASLPADSEAGVTSGRSACHQITPEPPASANWQYSVTVTDAWGNSGTRTKSITHLSPDASKYQLAVLGASVPTAPGKTIVLQLHSLIRDRDTGVLEPYAPDAAPHYRINYTDAGGAWKVAVPPTLATTNPATPHAWYANWTVPADWPTGRPALFQAVVNVSGLPISAQANILVEAPTAGGDPLVLAAADVYVGETQNISITARWDNGTARLGAATNISLHVKCGSSWIVTDANPTETTYPVRTGAYHYVFTPPAQEATCAAFGNVTTDLGEPRVSPFVHFRVLARPATEEELREARARLNDTLTAAAWLDWRDNEARPHRDRANQTLLDATWASWRAGEWLPAWARLNGTLEAAPWLDWRDQEARPARDRLNQTLLETAWSAWRDGEARPAWDATNNTLRAADWSAWLTGESRPAWATLNATATSAALAGLNASLQQDHDQIQGSIQDANSTASGALSYATWSAWNAGEYRPAWGTLNDTAREATLARVNASQWEAHNWTRGDLSGHARELLGHNHTATGALGNLTLAAGLLRNENAHAHQDLAAAGEAGTIYDHAPAAAVGVIAGSILTSIAAGIATGRRHRTPAQPRAPPTRGGGKL